MANLPTNKRLKLIGIPLLKLYSVMAKGCQKLLFGRTMEHKICSFYSLHVATMKCEHSGQQAATSLLPPPQITRDAFAPALNNLSITATHSWFIAHLLMWSHPHL